MAERDNDEYDSDDDDDDDYNNYDVKRERKRSRRKQKRWSQRPQQKQTDTTRRPSYKNAGWFGWLQRDFITDEVSGSIPVSSCFKQRSEKSRKMLTKVTFENKPVLVQSVENSPKDRVVPGSNPRSETLEDRIVLGLNPFRPNSRLLDYFNYYYEDRTAEVAAG